MVSGFRLMCFFSRVEMTSWWSFRILQAGVSLFVFDKYVIVFIFHCEGQWRLIVLRGYSGYSSCSVPMQPMQQMQQMQAPQARDLMKNGLFPKVWLGMIQDVFKIQEIRHLTVRLGKLEEKRFKIQNIGCGMVRGRRWVSQIFGALWTFPVSQMFCIHFDNGSGSKHPPPPNLIQTIHSIPHRIAWGFLWNQY